MYEAEKSEYAAAVVTRAVLAEGCSNAPRVLHADNGSPMKSATLRVTLERLGIAPSYSRPRVSNDNAFSEALFRTCKYRPDFPARGCADLAAARDWTHGFVAWYNTEHLHSAIQFVTPEVRHREVDQERLHARQAVYEAARARHPERWTGDTRNWDPVGAVSLNPERPPPQETG